MSDLASSRPVPDEPPDPRPGGPTDVSGLFPAASELFVPAAREPSDLDELALSPLAEVIADLADLRSPAPGSPPAPPSSPSSAPDGDRSPRSDLANISDISGISASMAFPEDLRGFPQVGRLHPRDPHPTDPSASAPSSSGPFGPNPSGPGSYGTPPFGTSPFGSNPSVNGPYGASSLGPNPSGAGSYGAGAFGPDAFDLDAFGSSVSRADASGPSASRPDAFNPDSFRSTASGPHASGPDAFDPGVFDPGVFGPGPFTPDAFGFAPDAFGSDAFRANAFDAGAFDADPFDANAFGSTSGPDAFGSASDANAFDANAFGPDAFGPAFGPDAFGPDGDDAEPTARSIAALLGAPATTPAELADAVAWCYDDAALPLLLPLAQHPDAAVRRAVAQALPSVLGEAPPDDTVHALILLSADRDDDVRDWACFALGTQLSEVDTPAVRQALTARLDDPHDDTRCEALLGLARRRDIRILPVLHERLDRDNVYSLEIDAAGALGHASLHTLVRGHLSGWDDDVVARVCAALRLTDPDGVGDDLLDGLADWFRAGAPHATDEDRYWWSVTLQLLEHAEYRAPEVAEQVHYRLQSAEPATALMLGSRLSQLAGDHGWPRWRPASQPD